MNELRVKIVSMLRAPPGKSGNVMPLAPTRCALGSVTYRLDHELVRERGAQRVILHDCDLIPDDTLLNMYRAPWPRPIVHFGARFARYNNSKQYFGGVHGFTAGYYPGYPNNFWGWGGEDDALRKRVALRDVTYARVGVYLDLEGFIRPTDKLRTLDRRDKCMNKHELLQSDDSHSDSHRRCSLVCTTSWEYPSDRLARGYVTHHRGA